MAPLPELSVDDFDNVEATHGAAIAASDRRHHQYEEDEKPRQPHRSSQVGGKPSANQQPMPRKGDLGTAGGTGAGKEFINRPPALKSEDSEEDYVNSEDDSDDEGDERKR